MNDTVNLFEFYHLLTRSRNESDVEQQRSTLQTFVAGEANERRYNVVCGYPIGVMFHRLDRQ